MGNPNFETDHKPSEGPQHPVRVASFLIGQTEVTVAQFRSFTQAKSYQTEAERNIGEPGCVVQHADTSRYGWLAGANWRKPGWDSQDNEPVVCVNGNDAQAYVDWLRQITGKGYQLPTEAQWEYAARAVTTRDEPSLSHYWGEDPEKACQFANFWQLPGEKCQDSYRFVAPVAKYKPNAFGLYDLLGNVWEWTADCYNNPEYQRRKNAGGEWPANKTSEVTSNCSHVARGGSFEFSFDAATAFIRYAYIAGYRSHGTGFRIARTLLP